MSFTEPLIAIIQANPRTSIIVIALLISFLISLVNFFILDKERIKTLRSRQKEIQAQMKEHQKAGNHEKAQELMSEMTGHMMESLKHSFKPMLFTMIPILVLFAIIRNTFNATAIASTWFWWYMGSAIVGSMVFRKFFDLP